MAAVVLEVKAVDAKRPLLCRLRVTGGAQPIEASTDEAGRTTPYDLADGQYAVVVVQPPESFVGPATPIPFTVNGADMTVEVPLTALKATITLTGIAQGDIDAVAQLVEFRVLRDESIVMVTAASQNNPATVSLPWPGTYRIVQSAAPRPYGLWSVPREQQATVTVAAPSTEVTFTQKKLTLSAQVGTGNDDTAGRAGAKLALVDSAGTDREITETGPDGKAVFNPPAVGLYQIVLRSAPPGFAAPYERTRSVQVTEPPEETPVTFAVVPSTKERDRGPAFWASFAIVVLLLIIGGFLNWQQLPAATVSVPASGATWVLFGFLLLLTLMNPKRGFFEPLIGPDNRASTSRVAPALWTLSLVWVIAFLLLDAGTNEKRIKAAFPGDRWDDYLVLLGGPFAAFVIAKGVTSWKVQNGQVQKANNEGAPTPADVFQKDDGTTSLVDSQYMAFNLVALVYFWAVAVQGLRTPTGKAWTLPIIPTELLALTGAAALTYAANKAIQNNKPTITAIEPATVRPGETVTIQGLNFRPDGVGSSDSVSVTIDGVGACLVRTQTNTRLECTVPPGAPVGLRNLVVTSAAKVVTEPRPLQIRPDKADLLGVQEAEVRPGGPLHLLTRGAHSPLEPGRTVFVFFNERRKHGELTINDAGAETVETRAPRDLEGTAVQLKVQSPQGLESDPITVPLAQRPTFPSPGAIRVAPIGNQIQARLTVEGFLAPNGDKGKSAVLVDEVELDLVMTETHLGADARDTVVAQGPPPPNMGSTVMLMVKDWLERISEPIQVNVG